MPRRTKEVYNVNKVQKTDASTAFQQVYKVKNHPQAVVSKERQKEIDEKLKKHYREMTEEEIVQLIKDKYMTPEAQVMYANEKKKIRDYLSDKINEITPEGITVGEKIAEKIKNMILDDDINPAIALKGMEFATKLLGEMVDKVARTDANGNDLANAIITNQQLLQIMAQREMKNALVIEGDKVNE